MREIIEKYHIPAKQTPAYIYHDGVWEASFRNVIDLEAYDPVSAMLWNLDVLNLYLRMSDRISSMIMVTGGYISAMQGVLDTLMSQVTIEKIENMKKGTSSHIPILVKGDERIVKQQSKVDTAKETYNYLKRYHSSLQEYIWTIRSELKRQNNYDAPQNPV